MIELNPILVVEDDPNDVELTLAAFEQHNLANEVVIVHDGQAALDYLIKQNVYATRTGGNPAVVLLDIKLPKIDGIQVLKTIRTTPGLKSVPVVMLTSSKEELDVTRCYSLGVNAYVVKPVQFDDFLTAVGKAGMFWAAVNHPPP